jgi:hypothetical protein
MWKNAGHMQRDTIYPVCGSITFKMKDDFLIIFYPIVAQQLKYIFFY